jgi:site-specific recombinase XerD
VAALRSWLHEYNPAPSAVLFPNARGQALSRDGVEFLLAKQVATARLTCPSLQRKRVSPHVLRHTTAMDLLQHGIDRVASASMLGR